MKSVLELEELAGQAIKAAMNQQWQQAIELNQQVLADMPDSVEAMNRLARAYQELGELGLAEETYRRVLTLDAYNPIAQKNLERLAQGSRTQSSSVSQELFLEEPGKTRIIQPEQPQEKYLSHLATGAKLGLEDRHGRLALKTPDGHVAGYVPDELSSHLLNLIQLGNTYAAYLMASGESPQVFLRETGQSPRAAKFISFARQHSASHHSGGKDLLNPDGALPIDPSANEEGLDDWDSEHTEDQSDPDLNDDFHSVSLEALREEEDSSYGSMRDEY